MLRLPKNIQAKQREIFAKCYATELGVDFHDCRETFDDELRILKSRRDKERSELTGATPFQPLTRGPAIRVFLKGDRTSTFYRCWVKAGDREVIYDVEIDYSGVSDQALEDAVLRDYRLI